MSHERWRTIYACRFARNSRASWKPSFRKRSRFRADWHAIRETLPIESCITGGVMARQRPHRKASISADLASLGFLLIISLIAGFAELIGPVSRVQLRPRAAARETRVRSLHGAENKHRMQQMIIKVPPRSRNKGSGGRRLRRDRTLMEGELSGRLNINMLEYVEGTASCVIPLRSSQKKRYEAD